MTDTASFPRQREVYLSRALRQSGDTKKRPVVVVSIDVRNQYSSTVLVVPFSSDTKGSGAISPELLERIQQGVQVAIGIFGI